MTRTILPNLAIGFLVLITAGGEVCRGDPPIVVDRDAMAPSGALQAFRPGFDPLPLPRIETYSNTGCKEDSDGGSDEPCVEQDELVLTVEGTSLHVLHRNATYNCCPEDIVISLTVQGNLLILTEEESLLWGGCDCWCCYDVEATVVDLAPGTYTVEFCWFDYETWEVQCCEDQIEVPGMLRGDPPVIVDPNDVMPHGAPQARPLEFDPVPPPRIEDYGRSGCLDDPNDPWYPPCGGDEIELTVEGNTLHVLHRNATYNCCSDDIVISLSAEEDLLMLTEDEIVPDPCYCLCCYNVEATVVDLAPGTYTVEFCWYDYETYQLTCYWEDIVIPRGGGDPPRPDPPVLSDPNDVAHSGAPPVPPMDISPLPPPHIDGHLHSGCRDDPNDPWFPPCGDDEIELTVDGSTLHVLHRNATYNCCPDDIVISLSVEENLLILDEEEILTNPCWCICCYNVEATVVDLAPGTYTVEFCWFDYEAFEVTCYWEDIVVPGD